MAPGVLAGTILQRARCGKPCLPTFSWRTVPRGQILVPAEGWGLRCPQHRGMWTQRHAVCCGQPAAWNDYSHRLTLAARCRASAPRLPRRAVHHAQGRSAWLLALQRQRPVGEPALQCQRQPVLLLYKPGQGGVWGGVVWGGVWGGGAGAGWVGCGVHGLRQGEPGHVVSTPRASLLMTLFNPRQPGWQG